VSNNTRHKVHALWMFDVADVDGAEDYFRYAIANLPGLGMKPISIGRFRAAQTGDFTPPKFYVLGEWDSEEAFQRFAENAEAAGAHDTREDATSNTIRLFFDGIVITDPDFRFEDLAALLKS
jgi:heme-degrading monooxygenase HmoA